VIYVDTSVIVKLYVREAYSLEVSDWIRSNNQSIPLTPLHELELINALELKCFRNEMSGEEVETILTNVGKHEIKGVFHRPQINWADAFVLAMDLSKKHTEKTGSRSLDIMHVATALTIGADRFLTLDERQSKLALIAGLRLENCVK
jgi:predicted nucleic acid-binding protein